MPNGDVGRRQPLEARRHQSDALTATDEGDLGGDRAEDGRYARDLGFGGKLCNHPKQTGAVLAAFRPDQAEIEWVRKVMASGDGAVAVDEAMVDEPVRVRARSILARLVADTDT